MLGDSKDVRHCSLLPVALLLVTQEQLWREQYLSTSRNYMCKMPMYVAVGTRELLTLHSSSSLVLQLKGEVCKANSSVKQTLLTRNE